MIAILKVNNKNSAVYYFPVLMLSSRNVNDPCNFKFSSHHINKKIKMKCIVVIHLILPSYKSNILSCNHIFKVLMRYLLSFLMLSLQNSVHVL